MHDPMHDWCKEMWDFPRSITGEGVRQTLSYLTNLVPELVTHSVPSGTEAFDWTVPPEWNVVEAFIDDNNNGDRLIDSYDNGLHLLGYSTPINAIMTREELEPHLYSIPEQPDAIPYITSYYKPRWGFCVTQKQRDALGDGPFHVVVDSTLKPGHLNYGELIIPGTNTDEVLLSCYICHPQMANDSLSGVVVTASLARWLLSEPRRLTYRILFIPETIGSICYLSKHLDEMKQNTIAGFVLTCVGDDKKWSYLPSPSGATLADRVALHVLKNAETLSYLTDRGSDERQYCSPGVGLPVCSIMRSAYAHYPEYHTSLDNLDFISQKGLSESFDTYKHCLRILEANETWEMIQPCEPFLTKHNLHSGVTTAESRADLFLNVSAYADGTMDLMELSNVIGANALQVDAVARSLFHNGILKKR
jgi:aminopeptidase-like protein